MPCIPSYYCCTLIMPLLSPDATVQKQGHLQAPFLDAMAACCHSERDATVWTRLLRVVLGDLSTLKQLGSSTTELEQQLRALDAFTTPPLLQRCLIAALASELPAAAAAAAGASSRGGAKVLEAASVLGSLLGVSEGGTGIEGAPRQGEQAPRCWEPNIHILYFLSSHG